MEEQLIGNYKILRKLGAGGMGVVLAAQDPLLDRKVAVKLLRPNATIQRTLRLSQILPLLEVFDEESEAVASFVKKGLSEAAFAVDTADNTVNDPTRPTPLVLGGHDLRRLRPVRGRLHRRGDLRGRLLAHLPLGRRRRRDRRCS